MSDSKAKQGPVVGIDLGTTNSVVAAIVNGTSQPLADEQGNTVIPSVVGLDPMNELITGTHARNQQVAFPEKTVSSIKRKMGTMEATKLGENSFTPPEISAMLLRRLREIASRALGTEVQRAVITVPAFFNEDQRQATREAGNLAGFDVERIINEPTAATLVYYAGSQDPKHIVVYDFGGGTFDVSVVRMEKGVVEVLSSKGDTKLGGDDIDQALLDHIAEEFLANHQLDLRDNPSTDFRLRQACEAAKRLLATQETVQIAQEFIAEKDGQPLHLKTSISRDDFNDLIRPIVKRTIDCVDAALEDSKLNLHQIADFVLVGGSTRLRLVEEMLRDEFRVEPSRAVDPDQAVALGAAIQGAMIEGKSHVGPVLIDIATHTLGVSAVSGFSLMGTPDLSFSPIIHRNSPLPTRHEMPFGKIHDDQSRVLIEVFQGEHEDLDRNHRLGEFSLDLEKGGGKLSKINILFDLTLDGTLQVTATQPASGKCEALKIDNALSNFKTERRAEVEGRLKQLFESSPELTVIPESAIVRDEEPAGGQPAESQDFSESFPAAVDLLKKAKQLASQFDDEDSLEVAELTEKITQAMQTAESNTVSQLCEQLDDILFYVQ